MFGTVVWTLTLFKLFYIFYGAMHIGFAEILCLNANDVMLNTKKQQTYWLKNKEVTGMDLKKHFSNCFFW
jgi:hypothetical protein